MASSFEKYQKRRLFSSYFSVVLSIALVLFLLGSLGLLVLNAVKVANYFKEQIPISIYFKETAKDSEIASLNKSLQSEAYTKNLTYTTKDEAAKKHSAEIGEDFMEYLGYNPLQNSTDFYLNAEFVDETQVAEIVAELTKKDFVDEVSYDKPLIGLLNNNIKKISFWILAISGLFTLIAVILINSSIRLSVYAKRFTIKTMQMVGATKGFIRRPFVWNNIKLGIIGALIAFAGLATLIYYSEKSFPQLELLKDKEMLAILFGGILLLSILITWLSTFFATQRFLNLRTDELYY